MKKTYKAGFLIFLALVLASGAAFAETAKEAYDKGSQYWSNEEDDKAIAQFKRALEIDSKYIDSYLTLGNIYLYMKHDYDSAVEYANKAVEAGPNNARAYEFRGEVYQYKGFYDQAISEFSKAIELKPDYAAAYNWRGTAYSGKQDRKQAISDYTKAIELKPDYINAYSNRSAEYYDAGEADKAEADWQKAESLKSKK